VEEDAARVQSLELYLIRHGETAWTLSGQHTSISDIALTERGRKQALSMKKRLEKEKFEAVLSSPMQRATDTCDLAGLSAHFILEKDAMEWNYGSYEGLTSAQIWERAPDWTIFTSGAPSGESLRDVTVRADRLIKKLLAYKSRIALFSHGHFLRVLAARWLGLPAQEGRLFSLDVASISILGFEHHQHTLKLWNDVPTQED